MVILTQTRLKAFGRFSNALGMDSITIIRQDTHRYMLLKRATSITIGVLTACFDKFVNESMR